jgi:folate-binding protein YgfZ
MFGDKVRVTDASGQVAVLRVMGEDAARVVAAATGLDAGPLAAGDWLAAGEDAATVWVLRHAPPPAGMGGVDVVVPRGEPAETMAARLQAAGAAPLSPAGYAAMRIALAVPAYAAEIDGPANPLELGLRSIVDFDKGCYIGQEVVARLDTYEKVQRRMVRLRADGPLAVGAQVAAQPGRVQRDGADDAGDTAGTGDAAAGARPGRRTIGRVTTAAPVPTTAEGSRAAWTALALVPASIADGQTVVVTPPEAGASAGSNARKRPATAAAAVTAVVETASVGARLDVRSAPSHAESGRPGTAATPSA